MLFLLKIPEVADADALPPSCPQTHSQHNFSLNVALFPTLPRTHLMVFCRKKKKKKNLSFPSFSWSLFQAGSALSQKGYPFPPPHHLPALPATPTHTGNQAGSPASLSGPILILLLCPPSASKEALTCPLLPHSPLIGPLSPSSLGKAGATSSTPQGRPLLSPQTPDLHAALTLLTSLLFKEPWFSCYFTTLSVPPPL